MIHRRQVLLTSGFAASTAILDRKLFSSGCETQPKSNDSPAKCKVRVTSVSFAPPFHDHAKDGVNLSALRDMTAQVAKERPDFICYPEICACVGGGMEKGIRSAPELDPYIAEVAKIAREFDSAIVAPFLEKSGSKVYNSVPIVNRRGELVLVYRKVYPTTGELEAGISPGTEIPVAECDGVRVGAAVCFDANFDQLAAELERQRARLVFWPSMYWGGQFLQHWALRYGFSIAVAYMAESAIIDMNGQYLVKQGGDTLQVRGKRLPPWASAEVHINRDVFHLDFIQDKFAAIRAKYDTKVTIEVHQPEGIFLLASNQPDLPIETIADEFKLETMRDYIARSVRMRDDKLNK
jgi:predicted amidohydrolase